MFCFFVIKNKTDKKINYFFNNIALIMVRSRRLELPRVLPHNDLNVTRIPIPPRPL